MSLKQTSTLTKLVDSRAVSLIVSGYDNLTIQRAYSMHPTGTLRPERVDIRWDGGELVKLTVSGHKLKGDGTVGLAMSTTHFVTYGKVWQKPIPGWLMLLLVDYHPTGQTSSLGGDDS